MVAIDVRYTVRWTRLDKTLQGFDIGTIRHLTQARLFTPYLYNAFQRQPLKLGAKPQSTRAVMFVAK